MRERGGEREKERVYQSASQRSGNERRAVSIRIKNGMVRDQER